MLGVLCACSSTLRGNTNGGWATWARGAGIVRQPHMVQVNHTETSSAGKAEIKRGIHRDIKVAGHQCRVDNKGILKLKLNTY
jgi:hypothetical protein